MQELSLAGNCLSSLPAEIGRLTSLKRLQLAGMISLFILEGNPPIVEEFPRFPLFPLFPLRTRAKATRWPLCPPHSAPCLPACLPAKATF